MSKEHNLLKSLQTLRQSRYVLMSEEETRQMLNKEFQDKVAKFVNQLITPGENIDLEKITNLAVEYFRDTPENEIKQAVKSHIIINYMVW